MFAKPRPKKSILPPPTKKRKTTPAIEEITFDDDARHEYLTGFHKRKQARIKHAQEEAAKRARQERVETRKQAREERKKEVEDHVNMVNKMLKDSGAIEPEENDEDEEAESDEWDGFPDRPNVELVDHEEEYIDEDRYTTVTVESVSVSRDGFEKPKVHDESDEEQEEEAAEKDGQHKDASESKAAPTKQPKAKKKKFRYENKFDRQMTDRIQRAKNKGRR